MPSIRAAVTEAERTQVVHDLVAHVQGQLQHKVDSAATPAQRTQAIRDQARYNNWTPDEQRAAELRTSIPGAGAPEADAHRTELMRQVENARSPQEAHQAQQAVHAYDATQEQIRQEQAAERERTATLDADLKRRFEALRGDGPQPDPVRDRAGADTVRVLRARGGPPRR